MNTPHAPNRLEAFIARTAHALITWRNSIAIVTALITLCVFAYGLLVVKVGSLS